MALKMLVSGFASCSGREELLLCEFFEFREKRITKHFCCFLKLIVYTQAVNHIFQTFLCLCPCAKVFVHNTFTVKKIYNVARLWLFIAKHTLNNVNTTNLFEVYQTAVVQFNPSHNNFPF